MIWRWHERVFLKTIWINSVHAFGMLILAINLCSVLEKVIILKTNLKFLNIQVTFILGSSSIIPCAQYILRLFVHIIILDVIFIVSMKAVGFDVFETSPRILLCTDFLFELNLDS